MVEEPSAAEEKALHAGSPLCPALPAARGAVLAGGCLWVPAALGALPPQQPQRAPPWHRIPPQGRDLRESAVPMGQL